MIKDESGEGMPVAWLITNREDICFLDPVRKPSRVAALCTFALAATLQRWFGTVLVYLIFLIH